MSLSTHNSVTLIGRLGQDPVIRYTQDKSPIATLNIATSDRWKDKETQQFKEVTDWHRVVVFGRAAEYVANNIKSGYSVLIEGQLKTRKWVNDQNVEQYITEVQVKSGFGLIKLISRPLEKNHDTDQKNSQNEPSNTPPVNPQPQEYQAQQQPQDNNQYNGWNDSIPF
ncbi:single-stranded DNA-binding protein [Rosenbergiella collisarenosi]|uniref:single-stranded DNA-binding protein n=1 Tax=Rosenbergiella collisarenosi TaxID=1544695 RepID=UPI001BD99515|nr:single-stranded DNA-binding protein [Rosenbergiella collisarenosi]MBT0722457.1 single-stranded DNA-binding protein [Rosenbergiella collisarenosi]